MAIAPWRLHKHPISTRLRPKPSKANDREIVSLFHIHGYIINSQGKGSHRADYAIQTIWETPKKRGDESARQCRVCVTDYTSFWEGILTRQDLDAERNSRFKEELEKDRYENLTREAFMGPDPAKEESSKGSVSLSVRSSAASPNELETILGTMLLKRVAAEESSDILRQWIKSTIDERIKIEFTASSLKSHVDGIKQQYQECNEALENFTKEKIEFTNNLLEKFRLLLNSKKEKIVKLVDVRNKQQERIENLEKALREERKVNAELQGKKITEADVDISDVKKQEDSDAEEEPASTSVRGSGRGRGRGRGTGRGSGKGRGELAARHGVDAPSQSSESASDTKRTNVKIKSKNTDCIQASTSDDAHEPQPPRPHPQDGYGWDGNGASDKGKDETDKFLEDDEEPLVRRGKSLIDRVSKAAAHVHSHQDNDNDKGSLSPRKRAIKREESDAADELLRRNQHDGDQSRHSSSHSENKSNKRLRSDDSGKVGSSTENTHSRKITKADSPSESGASSRTRRNFPVVAMRRPGASKASLDRNTPESAISSPEGSSSLAGARGVRGNASPQMLRRTVSAAGARSGSARRAKDSASNGGSIISHEDLIRNME
ncbi:hypothetical protein BGZ72_005796 [Mortierella alpina]|nr:hypothetical protein BGZ72_005796 [Mortierella alpina]